MRHPTNTSPARLLSRRLVIVAIILQFLCLSLPAESAAHEFEDGFVERSVAVVIRDNIARVEYSLGLNPKTKIQLIDFWKSQRPITKTAQEENTDDEAQPLSSEAPIDFLKLAGANLSQRLHVVVGKKLILPRLISSLASSRHHVDVTVTMEFILPQNEESLQTSVKITDRNFFPKAEGKPQFAKEIGGAEKEQHVDCAREDSELNNEEGVVRKTQLPPAPFGGGFRYAIKAKGGTVLSRSNVASILIRAKRQLDADLSESELDGAYVIEADILLIE